MTITLTSADLARARRQASAYAARTGTGRLHDEWESAALYGLAQAVATYDGRRSVPFWAHAIGRIRGAILDAARMEMPYGYRRRGDDAPHILPITECVDETPIGTAIEWRDKMTAAAVRMKANRTPKALPPPVDCPGCGGRRNPWHGLCPRCDSRPQGGIGLGVAS